MPDVVPRIAAPVASRPVIRVIPHAWTGASDTERWVNCSPSPREYWSISAKSFDGRLLASRSHVSTWRPETSFEIAGSLIANVKVVAASPTRMPDARTLPGTYSVPAPRVMLMVLLYDVPGSDAAAGRYPVPTIAPGDVVERIRSLRSDAFGNAELS